MPRRRYDDDCRDDLAQVVASGVRVVTVPTEQDDLAVADGA